MNGLIDGNTYKKGEIDRGRRRVRVGDDERINIFNHSLANMNSTTVVSIYLYILSWILRTKIIHMYSSGILL